MRMMNNQGWASLFFCLLFVFINLVLFDGGGDITLMKPSLDWFDPDRVLAYKWKSITTIRIVETITIIIGHAIMYKFPKNLSIWKEFFMISTFSFLLSWFYEITRLSVSKEVDSENSQNACFVFGMRSNFASDLVRAVFVPAALAFYSNYVKNLHVPSSLVGNFTHFLRDDECMKYFALYLTKQGNEGVDQLNIINSNALSHDTDYYRSADLRRLELAFRSYKKTKSYKCLKKRRQESESVDAIGFALNN